MLISKFTHLHRSKTTTTATENSWWHVNAGGDHNVSMSGERQRSSPGEWQPWTRRDPILQIHDHSIKVHESTESYKTRACAAGRSVDYHTDWSRLSSGVYGTRGIHIGTVLDLTRARYYQSVHSFGSTIHILSIHTHVHANGIATPKGKRRYLLTWKVSRYRRLHLRWVPKEGGGSRCVRL